MQKGEKLIINFTPTGMIPTKSDTPFVPISPSEIVEQVHEVYELGITLTHLHAREEMTGFPTYKAEVYEDILDGIKKHCDDLVTCVSLSGRIFQEFEKRSEVLELYPDMGSLTLSSLNFPKQESLNSPDMIVNLAKKMTKYGVTPELEVFDLGMINYAKYLLKKKIIREPLYFNIILGNITSMQTELLQIGIALKELPDGSIWSLGGIGNSQLVANTLAIIKGGGVRVGIEDNIYFDLNKKRKTSNIELIRRIHELANIFERHIMSPNEFGDLGFYNQFRDKTLGIDI